MINDSTPLTTQPDAFNRSEKADGGLPRHVDTDTASLSDSSHSFTLRSSARSLSRSLNRSSSASLQNITLLKQSHTRLSRLSSSSINLPSLIDTSKLRIDNIDFIDTVTELAKAILEDDIEEAMTSGSIITGAENSQNVFNATGIPSDFFPSIIVVAQENNVIIGFRPVEKVATSLVGKLPSKPIHIKGKSSNIPFFAGRIPTDQKFSKLVHKGDIKAIEKSNSAVKESIQAGHAVSAPLTLTLEQITETLEKSAGPDSAYEGTVSYSTSAEGGRIRSFVVDLPNQVQYHLVAVTENLPVTDQSVYTFYEADPNQPLDESQSTPCLSHPDVAENFTADMDPLTFGFQPQEWSGTETRPTFKAEHRSSVNVDSSKKPALKSSAFGVERTLSKGIQARITSLRKSTTGAGQSKMVFENFKGTKEMHDDGNISSLNAFLRDEMNEKLGFTGDKEVYKPIHHGADADNPFSAEADLFPATFFLPTAIANIPEGPIVIKDAKGMQLFIRACKDAGYELPLSPNWSNLIGETSSSHKSLMVHHQAMSMDSQGIMDLYENDYDFE